MRALLLLMLTCWVAWGQRLIWDASPEPDVDRYIVYAGHASRQYTTNWTVLGRTNTQFRLPDTMRADTNTVYWAVTARTRYGLESDYSDEVTTVRPAPPARLRIRVTIEGAADLARPDWRTLATFDREVPMAGRSQFFRARLHVGRDGSR